MALPGTCPACEGLFYCARQFRSSAREKVARIRPAWENRPAHFASAGRVWIAARIELAAFLRNESQAVHHANSLLPKPSIAVAPAIFRRKNPAGFMHRIGLGRGSAGPTPRHALVRRVS